MRGDDQQQDGLFSYLSPEQRVPRNHPLRRLRPLVDEVLGALSSRFSKMYARVGRPSIAPEKLLRALLLQGVYSVRSERLLMEQLDYNLLFRWFVGLSMDDPVVTSRLEVCPILSIGPYSPLARPLVWQLSCSLP